MQDSRLKILAHIHPRPWKADPRGHLGAVCRCRRHEYGCRLRKALSLDAEEHRKLWQGLNGDGPAGCAVKSEKPPLYLGIREVALRDLFFK